MKKLFFVLLLAGLAYGVYRYLETVQTETGKCENALKPGEKALKEAEKEDAK